MVINADRFQEVVGLLNKAHKYTENIRRKAEVADEDGSLWVGPDTDLEDRLQKALLDLIKEVTLYWEI